MHVYTCAAHAYRASSTRCVVGATTCGVVPTSRCAMCSSSPRKARSVSTDRYASARESRPLCTSTQTALKKERCRRHEGRRRVHPMHSIARFHEIPRRRGGACPPSRAAELCRQLENFKQHLARRETTQRDFSITITR